MSAGPGDVSDRNRFANSMAILDDFGGRVPVFGVCLGLQMIAQVFGAKIRRMPRVRHGHISRVRQTGTSVMFADVPESFLAMRYHSLAVDISTLGATLKATAWSEDDNELMALESPHDLMYGVQFHPESIGTPNGPDIFRNFLRLPMLEERDINAE